MPETGSMGLAVVRITFNILLKKNPYFDGKPLTPVCANFSSYLRGGVEVFSVII